ncbi:MAG: hypothetical protein ACK53T_15860 [Planctomycetota bacterium]|jgi:hypothetical protein
MAAPQADGRPLRAHLTAAVTQGALPAAALEPPPLPPACATVWAWWTELASARPSAGFGLSPLAFGELAAWARLTGERPAPIEVRAIMAADAAWRQAVDDARPRGAGK